MEWNSLTKVVSIIGSTSLSGNPNEMSGLNADGTWKFIQNMHADLSNRILHVECVLRERSGAYIGRGVWAYDPAVKSWTCVSSNNVPYSSAANQVAYKAVPATL